MKNASDTKNTILMFYEIYFNDLILFYEVIFLFYGNYHFISDILTFVSNFEEYQVSQVELGSFLRK